MKRYILAVAAVLMLSGCSTMEVVTDLVLVADWSQSRQITEIDDIKEGNMLLGEDPSEGRVNTYFASCLVLNTVIHRVIPDRYLKYYQTTLIGIQVSYISNNYSLGVEVEF